MAAEKGKEAAKAVAKERWEKGEFSNEEERAYGQAAHALWGLEDTDEEEEAARRVAHRAGMRAVEVWWEDAQDRPAAAVRITPPPQRQQPQHQQAQLSAPPQQQQEGNWAQRAAAAAALAQSAAGGFSHVGRKGKPVKEPTGLEPMKHSLP